MRLIAVGIISVLLLEVAALIAFFANADNWDCGSYCGTWSNVLRAIAFVGLPALFVILLIVALVGIVRREQR